MDLRDHGGSTTRQRAVELIQRELRVGDPPGAAGLLGRLCRAVTQDRGLCGAAVTVLPEPGSHSVVAASSAAIRGTEELQFDSGEGPTRDAYRGHRPVVAADLEAVVGRWPGFAPAALGAGVSAVFALPLHVGAARLGALTLYWQRPQRPEAPDLSASLVFAELATEILVDASYASPSEGVDPSLHNALETHGHIYQAQGMVMVDLKVSLPESLARMRAHAYASGQDLAALASDILDGKTVLQRDPEVLTQHPDTPEKDSPT